MQAHMNEAAQLALLDFEREYDGTVCAVCQQEKWAQSPFCKSCSIKLQRAHLMKALQSQIDHYGREGRKWPPFVLDHFWRHYDTCRMYLIDVHRHFNSEKERTEA